MRGTRISNLESPLSRSKTGMEDGGSMPALDIVHTNDHGQAERLRDAGYEPVECAFGQYGSVLGPLALDHHGEESHREGVALRACRDLYGRRKDDPRFVVTGTPDADAILAIVALAALIPRDRLRPEFYQLVNRNDLDPVGVDLMATDEGEHLAWFNQRSNLYQNTAGFQRAVGYMVELLTSGLDEEARRRVQGAERSRRRKARDGIRTLYARDGVSLTPPAGVESLAVRRGALALSGEARVLVVQGDVWGFDQWYRLAPVVVSYASRMAKITVGCPDRGTAELLFGDGGLLAVWPVLGRGWGGREAIGGSPRGVRRRASGAEETAGIVLSCLRA